MGPSIGNEFRAGWTACAYSLNLRRLERRTVRIRSVGNAHLERLRLARLAEHRRKKGVAGTAAAESPFPGNIDRQWRARVTNSEGMPSVVSKPPDTKQFVCRSPKQWHVSLSSGIVLSRGSRVSLPDQWGVRARRRRSRAESRCGPSATGMTTRSIDYRPDRDHPVRERSNRSRRGNRCGSTRTVGSSLRSTERGGIAPISQEASASEIHRDDAITSHHGSERDYSGSTPQRMEVAVAIPTARANGQCSGVQ